MFTLVFIFCIRFLIRFSSRSHRLTIWDMMVCQCECVCLCVFWFVWGAPRKRERERECVRERDRDDGVSAMMLLLLFFRGAFANECDLDLSSWFIILRCLRSCCCSHFSFRALVVVAVALCALVCAFVFLLLLVLYWPLWGIIGVFVVAGHSAVFCYLD